MQSKHLLLKIEKYVQQRRRQQKTAHYTKGNTNTQSHQTVNFLLSFCRKPHFVKKGARRMSSQLRVAVRRRQAMLHQQSNPNLHGLEEPTCVSQPSLRPCGPLGCAAGFVPHSGSQASFLFCRNYWNRERTRLIAHGFLMPLPQSDMCHLCSHFVSQSKTFGCAQTHAIKKTLSPLLP